MPWKFGFCFIHAILYSMVSLYYDYGTFISTLPMKDFHCAFKKGRIPNGDMRTVG